MMSTFNRFCSSVKNTFKKLSDKTEELFDSAACSVKIKNLEMKIDEQYENLGRIVYRDLHTEENLEEEKLRVIAAIDALFDRITELKSAPAAEAEYADAFKDAAQGEQPTEESAAEPAAEPTAEEAAKQPDAEQAEEKAAE